MQHEVFLSVIMPIYNMQCSLEKAVNSVLSQTFSNFELILIDDGSTDRSVKIAEKIATENEQVKYFKQCNKGVSATRNAGLDIAVGKYTVFMDADDYISPTYYWRVFENFNDDAEIIITGITKVYDDERVQEICMPKIGHFSKREIFENFIELQLTTGLLGFASNKFILSSIIRNNNLRFNETIRLCEDLEFFTRFYPLCKHFYCVKENGNFYSIIRKDIAVDYISLSNIFSRIELMLRKENLFTGMNEKQLLHYQSDLKFAYFNEMTTISFDKVRDGSHNFQNIIWQKTTDPNKKNIRKLAEHCHFRILTVYLIFRKQYVNLRRRWS